MSSKAKRQRGKAAAKAPPKKGTKRARDEDKADKFAESVLASVTCPISHSLVVQPVVAEDGQVYERERIETWLQKKETSPFTRKPMGTQLVDSVASRSIVASAIENGLVDAEAASAWHLGSARLKVVEKLPGGLDAAKEHLDAAAKSPEREMLLKAFKLREQVKKFGDEAAALGLGSEVERLLQYKAAGSLSGRPMTEWRDDLVEGQSVIRVIDDVDELEHLCERLAPGAEEDVGWNEDMRHLCGRECVIDCLNDECRAYGVDDDYLVPFDACILVRV